MIKYIFFDLDDTLFDHTFSSSFALKKVAFQSESLGKLSESKLNNLYQKFLEEVHLRILNGEVSDERARIMRFRLLFDFVGEKISDSQIKFIADNYREAYMESRREVPWSTKLLKELRNRKIGIGVVTNNITYKQIGKIKACNFNNYIDFLVTSEDVGFAKPSPEIFKIALEKSACQASEVKMVGDSWESDIMGALGVNISPIWFNRTNRPLPDLSVTSIISFEKTEEIVFKLLNGDNKKS